MSTWEERMSARARSRIAAQVDADRRRKEAAFAVQHAAEVAEQQARHDAGPPCANCYRWLQDYISPWFRWVHYGTDVEGWTIICRCSCHPTEERWTEPPMA